MGIRSRARLLVLVLVLALALPLAGCSDGGSAEAASPQAAYQAIVAKADAAWEAGDAETAFELYTEALKSEGASDSDGSVGQKQEKAKRLMLSRRILDKSEPSLDSISSYVQVLEYSSEDSTEAAAARSGLALCLTPYPKEMRAEVAALRKRIKAGKSVEMPATVYLARQLADGWRSEVAQAPAPSGERAATAVEKIAAAAKAVYKAFDRTYDTEALKDLAAADRALDAADRELEALSSGR